MKVTRSILALSLAYATFTLAMPARHGPTPANPLKRLELQRRDELEKRQFQLIPMAIGLWLAVAGRTIGESVIKAIAKSLDTAFGQDPAPWDSGDEKCTISFSTHSGGECTATINAMGIVSERNDWDVCAWIDPENNDPGVQYFTDEGVGDYSIQFTATSGVAWNGIENTATCVAEGLCNPRITFYRETHSIILDTWLSQGDRSEGYYHGDFGGLCGNGPVKDQFTPNGNVLGFDCGIPCEGTATLPSTEGR